MIVAILSVIAAPLVIGYAYSWKQVWRPNYEIESMYGDW
jgi:hypothetical protein